MEETTPNYGIVPATGVYGEDWPSGYTPTFPQGIHGEISAGGWTKGNEGFVQQTFLGASISNFNLSAGFGQSSTTLNVSLVNDEYNKADQTFLGSGDDVYHNGKHDLFTPPTVGSPVFFKFGKTHATVDQAYKRTYNEFYGKTPPKLPDKTEDFTVGPINNIPKNYFLDNNPLQFPIDQTPNEEVKWEDQTELRDPNGTYTGWNHFVFGGILSSYKKDDGNARVFSATVSDPREILSNVQLILNDYKGSVGNNKNILNIFGFLEYDRSLALIQQMETNAVAKNLIYRDVNGFLIGSLPDPITAEPTADCYRFKTMARDQISSQRIKTFELQNEVRSPCLSGNDFEFIQTYFPITGQGMARRCNQGIPWYRVFQALKVMTSWGGWDFGFSPCEYASAGFGGVIDYRGRNFVIDLSGLPLAKIPQTYYINSDQTDLLSLLQEVCEAISHDYTISLLPVLHSGNVRTNALYEFNRTCMRDQRYGDIITGIIRIDTVDQTRQPDYGTVASYIESLEERGVPVASKDIGFSNSNVTTDRVVTGHQEVSMYIFNSVSSESIGDLNFRTIYGSSYNKDRFSQAELEKALKSSADHFNLKYQVETQPCLPFFGYMDTDQSVAVVPKGNQICLNAATLDAIGVGNYYITTYEELAAAQLGYINWVSFLNHYNYRYASNQNAPTLGKLIPEGILREFDGSLYPYSDTVEVIGPRCVWPSETPYMTDYNIPATPSSPPYGYPLYFMRASMFGVDTSSVIQSKVVMDSIIPAAISARRKIISQAVGMRAPLSTDDLLEANEDGDISNIELLRIMESAYGKKYGTNISWSERIFQKKPGEPNKFTEPKKLVTDGDIAAAVAKIITKNEEQNVKDGGNRPTDGDTVNNMFKDAKAIAEFIRDRNREAGGQPEYKLSLSPEAQVKSVSTINAIVGDIVRELEFAYSVYTTNAGASRHLRQFQQAMTNNAQKIHTWLKNIADTYMGKQYLVKIPKATNLNYSTASSNTITLRVNSQPVTLFSDAGPFGFPPLEIPGRSFPPAPSPLNGIEEYLDSEYVKSANAWTHGALKNSWNPVTNDWNFNYTPANGGGVFSIAMETSPVKYNFYPGEGSNLQSEGRISPYVSFGASEDYVDYTEIPKEAMTIVGDGDKRFVQCEMAEKFVMLPQLVEREVKVYGDGITPMHKLENMLSRIKNQETLDNADFQEGTEKAAEARQNGDFFLFGPGNNTVKGNRAYFTDYNSSQVNRDRNAGYMGNKVWVWDFARTITGTSPYTANIRTEIPDPYFGGRTKQVTEQVQVNAIPETFLISKPYLNPDHVYAVVTLPGAAKNWAEQNIAVVGMVVTPEQVPGMSNLPVASPYSYNLDEKEKIQAYDLSNPEVKYFGESQTPIVPDFFVLPLMSNERCYGPWMSASPIEGTTKRFADIGGKVEYIKEENLSPWNYGSYLEMHQAGVLKAQFSNSLLLFSENGSFTFPDAPAGLTIARPLQNPFGPLVTSVNVNIGDSVQTTVSMNAFMSDFGRLKKQTEDFLLELGRQKRKLQDERNRAIRALSTKLGSRTFNRNNFVGAGGFDPARMFAILGNNTAQTELSCSSFYDPTNRTLETQQLDLGLTGSGGLTDARTYYNAAAISDNKGFIDQANQLIDDKNLHLSKEKCTGRESLNNFFLPFDHQPDNPNMPNFDFISKSSIDRRTS